MLNDPQFFQAVFHSLPQVKAMVQAQSELSMANEELARKFTPELFQLLFDMSTRKQHGLAGRGLQAQE